MQNSGLRKRGGKLFKAVEVIDTRSSILGSQSVLYVHEPYLNKDID